MTRLIPRTSLVMRVEMALSASYGIGNQSAVIKSDVSTARKATACSYVRLSPITPTDLIGSSTTNAVPSACASRPTQTAAATHQTCRVRAAMGLADQRRSAHVPWPILRYRPALRISSM